MEIRYMLPTDDLYEVSNIYEQSWKYAYRGIVPQSFLDSIPPGSSVSRIRESGRQYLVAVENDTIIGTSSFCGSRWEQYKDYGEIATIYFLPEYMGKGYGRLLLGRTVEELRQLGYDHILLWVFEDNHRARRFYEKCGFILSNEKQVNEIGGKELSEVMYYFHTPHQM